MNILIICKGSSKLGLGHLLRSRSFAIHAQQMHNVKVIAYIDKGLENIFDSFKINTVFVYNEKAIYNQIRDLNSTVVILDLTDINRSIFIYLRRFASGIVSISPIFKYSAEIDILFLRTKNFNKIPKVKIIGGLKYSIFNEYCERIEDDKYFMNLSLKESPIAICMGGADAANKTLSVLKKLAKIKTKCTFWVLLGAGYSHSYNELVEVANENKQHEIILAKTSRSMWKILSNSVVAILAGGLTTVEAVFAGLPTINLFEREAHLDAMSQELFKRGVCLNGGFFNEKSLNELSRKIENLLKNRSKLLKMRERTLGLVDKQGSKRILKEIDQFYSYPKKVRNGN